MKFVELAAAWTGLFVWGLMAVRLLRYAIEKLLDWRDLRGYHRAMDRGVSTHWHRRR